MSGESRSINDSLVDILSSFRRHFETIELKRSEISHKIALMLIVFIAFLFRIFGFLQGDDVLIGAFDPYVQFRATDYLIENGFINFLDWYRNDEWYPWGVFQARSLYWGVPMSGYLLYTVVNLVGIPMSSQEAAYFHPAIFGTIGVIYSYFVGKELGNRRVGLFVALFMAALPAYIVRTRAGFFDNEGIGVLLIMISIYHFMRSLRTNSTWHGILSGISLGVLIGSWGASRYLLGVYPLYAVLLVLLGRYSSRLLKSYTLTVGISLFIGVLLFRNNGEYLLSVENFIPLSVIFFLSGIALLNHITKNINTTVNLQNLIVQIGFFTSVVGAIVIALASVADFVSFIPQKFISVFLPTSRSSIYIIDSVSEHAPATWSSLFNNIYILVFLIPVGLYFCMKRVTTQNVFIITWGVSTIYFTAAYSRLVLLLGPAAAVLAAIAIDGILYSYALAWHDRLTISRRKRRLVSVIQKEHAVTVYIILSLLCVIFVLHGADYAQNSSSGLLAVDGISDWQEGLTWLRENANTDPETGEPAVVLSWWDYGYWISNYGSSDSENGVKTLVDNATFNDTQIGVVGAMLMREAPYSIRLMYKFNIKYVLVQNPGGLSNFAGSDLGKAIWMIRISEQASPQFGVTSEEYIDLDADDGAKFIGKYYDSVLYKLSAYANILVEADYQGTLYRDAGLPENAVPSTSEGLSWDTGHAYFTEVFRGSGTRLSGDPAYYRNPVVRIFEVNYPENIDALANELDLGTGLIESS